MVRADDDTTRERARGRMIESLDRTSQNIFGVERNVRNVNTGATERVAVGGLFGRSQEDVAALMGRPGLPPGAAGPIAPQNTSIVQNSNVEIKVDGAKDPKQVGKEVVRELKTETDRRQYEHAAKAIPGVAR
jgi:hypothetical protein